MVDSPKSPAKMWPFTLAATPPNIFIVSTRGSFGSAARKMGWFSGGILTQAMRASIRELARVSDGLRAREAHRVGLETFARLVDAPALVARDLVPRIALRHRRHHARSREA